MTPLNLLPQRFVSKPQAEWLLHGAAVSLSRSEAVSWESQDLKNEKLTLFINPFNFYTMSKYQKVEFEYPVAAVHGKPCSHTNVYFGVNGFTKKPYISKLCYPSTTVTAGMLAQRNLFRDASNYAKAQMTDATKRAAAEVRFNAQEKYHTLRTFLMSEFMAGNGVEG